MTTVQGFTI